jgi:putative hydrolase of the HAD superfamily
VRATVRFAVFDLGGVVCRFEPESRLRALTQVTGRSAAEIHAAIWDSGLDRQAELGEIDERALHSRLLAALGADIDADALRAAWSLAFEPDDDVLALIDRLAVPAVLFSNNGPIVDRGLDHELSNVRARFAHVLLSWRLGAVKPDPAAYEAVAARLAVEEGAQVFFVDDSPENVAAARARGWHAEAFVDVATLQRQLAEHQAVESA